MNPETLNLIDSMYDHLPLYRQASGDSVNEVLGLLDTGVNTLNPDFAVWDELDQCEDFVELIDVIALYCGLEATQLLAIFCLDRGLVNCQMEFHTEIYDEYLLSEVQTYKRIVA